MASKHEKTNSLFANEFCHRHSLALDSLVQPDLQVIELLMQTAEGFSDGLAIAIRDELIAMEEPTWGIVRAMILRCFEHAEAGFVCLAAESVSTSEVVSRVILESALNVLYILDQERVCRLYDYLAGYVAQERTELDKWQKLADAMPAEELVIHEREIVRKKNAVDQLEGIVHTFASAASLNGCPRPWPRIIERFRVLGKDVDYRLLYAAMCSQAHNDAEDLFNTFVQGNIAYFHTPEVARVFATRQKGENLFFARLLLYRAIEYACQCVRRYGESYALPAITAVGTRGCREAREIARVLCENEEREVARFRETIGSS